MMYDQTGAPVAYPAAAAVLYRQTVVSAPIVPYPTAASAPYGSAASSAAMTVAYPTAVVAAAPLPRRSPSLDTQRKATHQPGYSAKFTNARLNCLYCVLMCPWCCSGGGGRGSAMARDTHLDVYTNGVLFAKPDFTPHACWGPCCGREPLGRPRYFDHPAFSQSVTSDGLCYGRGWAFIACQGSFGEQITLRSACCRDCCAPSGLAHFATCCTCCGIAETVFGLREDEGRKLAAIINEQVAIFRAKPALYRLDPIVRDGIDTKMF